MLAITQEPRNQGRDRRSRVCPILISLCSRIAVGNLLTIKTYLAASPVVGAATTVESAVTESATGATAALSTVVSAAGASSFAAHAVKPNTATARMNLYIVYSP